MPSPLPASRRLAAFGSLLLLLVLAGCASDGDRPGPKRGAGRPRHFPTMAGTETFFNGTLSTEVLVGAMTGFDAGNPDGGPGGGEGGGRRHRGGGMHMGGGGGGGGPRMGGGMGGPGGEGPSREEDPEAHGNQAMRRADAMGSPPVMIHLRFTNHGTAKADVLVADFLSPLGNFVVSPEKFSLEPGQALEVDPMTSRLAGEITSGEITLSLKLNGAKETKTITLALKPEPKDQPPPTPETP